jgi:hypothetical protein
MHFGPIIAPLAPFFVLVQADVLFTAPPLGLVHHVGTPLTMAWIESGAFPLITDLTSYELSLCAGGNDPTTILQLATIATAGQYAKGYQVTANIDPTIGGSAPGNA